MTKRIVFTNSEGGTSIIIPAPGILIQDCMKDVPSDALDVEIIDVTDVPADRTFRNAWKRDTTPAPQKIAIDMVKAKDITHSRRRAKRDVEFAPHDEIIMKQLPGKSDQQAEAARASIRQKYDSIQLQIDAVNTPDALKAIIDTEGL